MHDLEKLARENRNLTCFVMEHGGLFYTLEAKYEILGVPDAGADHRHEMNAAMRSTISMQGIADSPVTNWTDNGLVLVYEGKGIGIFSLSGRHAPGYEAWEIFLAKPRLLDDVPKVFAAIDEYCNLIKQKGR
ncbi:hypothetical protein JXB02_01540 [Candidatus Woesearchaeota archaeon]|nr:hypothetical protein [Candidatus Woesearchaeota archaeon]